jgi:hypothetical protein
VLNGAWKTIKPLSASRAFVISRNERDQLVDLEAELLAGQEIDRAEQDGVDPLPAGLLVGHVLEDDDDVQRHVRAERLLAHGRKLAVGNDGADRGRGGHKVALFLDVIGHDLGQAPFLQPVDGGPFYVREHCAFWRHKTLYSMRLSNFWPPDVVTWTLIMYVVPATPALSVNFAFVAGVP